MGITVSNPNNITSPIGNALAIFKDSATNNFFVVDINGKTESLERALGQENLQEVLDIGNSALQDMTVNGKITFGESNTNSGTRSFIAGSSNTISSGNNFVIGNSNTNSGSEGIVIGSNNTLESNTTTSIVIGKGNQALANNSYLFGYDLNSASYENCFLIGNDIGVGGFENSFAFGQHLNSNVNTFEVILGQYNLTGITRAGYSPQFSFGVGRDALNKENALVIWKQTSSPFANLFDFTGTLTLNNYGGGTITGTPTYRLGVDIAGNVIEITDGGGTVTSVGLTTGITGTDVNVTNSPITSSGDITLNIPVASASNTGKLSSTDWTTFNSKEDALTKGDLTETTSSVLTITGGTNAVIGSGTTIAVSQATTSTNGYLSSTDWNTFNNKQNALTFGDLTETTSSILTITGGTGSVIGSGTTIAVAQANASTSGFLSSTDWNTFNNKTSNTGTVTSVGISSGGGLSVSGSPITTSGTITLTNTDTGSSQNIFKNIAVSGQNTIVADSNDDTLTVVAGTGISVTTNDTTDTLTITNTNTTTGTVTSVGLTTGTTGTDVNVTNSPITSSGTFVLNIPIASASNTGKLSSTDWSTFNSKQSALTFGNLTETTSSILTITGGTGSVIGSGTTIAVAQANASTSGFLSSTDWNTFNNKTSNTGTVTSVGLSTGTTGTDVNISGSPITSSGTITLNIPTASASNTGKLSSTDWSTFNSKIAGSGTTGYYPVFNSSNTVISGEIRQAGGTNALLIGDVNNNTANGAYAIAGGQQSFANGAQSFTSGFGNSASGGASATLGGASNTSSGSNSIVLGGQNNTASGQHSIAGGDGSTANGVRAFAYGFGCNVQSNASTQFGGGGGGQLQGGSSFYVGGFSANITGRIFGFGDNHNNTGTRNFLTGQGHQGQGFDNLLTGGFNILTGSGNNNIIGGGTNEIDVGNESLVVGRNNFIDIITGQGGGLSGATGSIVYGESCQATDNAGGSITGGFDCNNFSRFGVAIGRGATASLGENQFAFGQGITTPTSGSLAYGEGQFATGLYNVWATGGRIHRFAVGNGTSDGSRANAMNVDSLGRMGLGVTSPSSQLQLSLNSASKPTSTLWTVVSDERIKENIRPYEKGLDEILQIETKVFDYNGKAGYPKTKDNIGVIAQEIQSVFPETINTFEAKLNEEDESETELFNFDGHALTYALINSVKELSAKIEELQEEINILKA